MIRHGVIKDLEVDNEIEDFIYRDKMEESVKKHEVTVLLNPYDYNSWNYLKMQADKEVNRDDYAERQMLLTFKALHINPKSYATWHHRHYFLKKGKHNLLREQGLCKLLISHDSRNFHCWNYCLKNDIKLDFDLHNPSSIYFSCFQESFLYIDPTDESVWRSYESKDDINLGRINFIIRNDGMMDVEILLNKPIIGSITFINTFKFSTTKRIILYSGISMSDFVKIITENYKNLSLNNLSHNCKSEYNDIYLFLESIIDRLPGLIINAKKYKFVKYYNSSLIEGILRLDSNCIHGLKHKFIYGNGGINVLEKLKKLDEGRKDYYSFLDPILTFHLVSNDF